MTNTLLDSVIGVLKKDARLVSEDGELLKNKAQELAYKLDPQLIGLLLKDKVTKSRFFTEIEECLIFNQDAFVSFVMSKEFLPDSYTKYRNQIGLNIDRKTLDERKEVSLVWAYKDCVLAGGQDKEDTKRDEIFYNETLGSDQIDRLLDPKVFTEFKRIDKDGKHPLKGFKKDKEGNIKDNLIIKGNNLLALHSLKKQFKGKVKLIYIDPPYNTGNDSFKYNDRFNHSTWLTFMRNRLEIAKELLRKDGFIFLSINHVELGYCLVLLDEIFGNENKLPIITLRAGTTASYRSINESPVNVTEYVIGYKKSEQSKTIPIYEESEYSEDYSHYITNKQEKSSKWVLENLNDTIHNIHGCSDWKEFKKKFGAVWKSKRYEEKMNFAYENKDTIVSLNTLQKPSKEIQIAINQSKKNRDTVCEVTRDEKDSIYCYNGRTLAFLSSKFRKIDGEEVLTEIQTNLWTDISFLGIGPEGNVDLPNGKKPELLIKKIIELCCNNEADIILDYHLGSGTTGAVAHKIGRQYIGIEQMNYGENDSTIRLENVIQGEQSGISKSVDWKGGGDFVYMEIACDAENYVQKIRQAKDTEALLEIWGEMKSKSFINYKLDPQSIDNTLDTFKTLSLEDQKKTLIDLIDKNALYKNLSEMDDKESEISEEDKKLNRDFYNL